MPNSASTAAAAVSLPVSFLARQSPHVLLASDSPDPSGVGEHMVTLALALRSQAKVTLLFSDTPEAMNWSARAQACGLAVAAAPAIALRAGSAECRTAVGKLCPDLVHVHAGIGWEGHELAAAARLAGVAAVVRTEHLPYTLRALKSPELEAAYARGVQAVDRIICVCEAARRTFRMSGVEAARYAVIHNGITPRSPQRGRNAVRDELGIGGRKLVLTVARFTEQKRHATLLKALPALAAACPDVCLAWVGTGPLERDLRAEADRIGLADRILFLGRRSDVPDLMEAADLFCLPSFFEGHPLVVLEAMAAGLPVVATRSLGNTEAVRNGETGLLVPVDNASALAAAVTRVLNDAALAARLREAGRASMQREFSAARMAAATLAVYRGVLDGRPARGQAHG